jgi:hypothetical protein
MARQVEARVEEVASSRHRAWVAEEAVESEAERAADVGWERRRAVTAAVACSH